MSSIINEGVRVREMKYHSSDIADSGMCTRVMLKLFISPAGNVPDVHIECQHISYYA